MLVVDQVTYVFKKKFLNCKIESLLCAQHFLKMFYYTTTGVVLHITNGFGLFKMLYFIVSTDQPSV